MYSFLFVSLYELFPELLGTSHTAGSSWNAQYCCCTFTSDKSKWKQVFLENTDHFILVF